MFFCERKKTLGESWGNFSLTERTEFTEVFGAHFELTERLGIQSSQSVTANVGTNKGQQVAYILLIGVSR